MQENNNSKTVLQAIKEGNGKTISVEVEPPVLGIGRKAVFELLDPLVKLGISYVDITYHAQRIVNYRTNGSPVLGTLKPGTVGIAGAILERYRDAGVFPVPHVICTSFNQDDTQQYLADLHYLGVHNILALRGDPQKNENGKFLGFEPVEGGHAYAKDLIRQVANLRKGIYFGATGDTIDFCIGAACFPEGNSEFSLEQEVEWLKGKIDAGANYFVTQMFFDPEAYARFVDTAAKAGINADEIRIVPGLKPITTAKQLEILPKYFNCSFPAYLAEGMEKNRGNQQASREVGIEKCVELCERLRGYGAPSLHFYASRDAPVREVIQRLK